MPQLTPEPARQLSFADSEGLALGTFAFRAGDHQTAVPYRPQAGTLDAHPEAAPQPLGAGREGVLGLPVQVAGFCPCLQRVGIGSVHRVILETREDVDWKLLVW